MGRGGGAKTLRSQVLWGDLADLKKTFLLVLLFSLFAISWIFITAWIFMVAFLYMFWHVLLEESLWNSYCDPQRGSGRGESFLFYPPNPPWFVQTFRIFRRANSLCSMPRGGTMQQLASALPRATARPPTIARKWVRRVFSVFRFDWLRHLKFYSFQIFWDWNSFYSYSLLFGR